MIVTSLLAAGAFASQAAAFLVPLEVAKAVKTVEDNLPLNLIDQKSSSLSLECTNCFFDTANDRQDDYAANPENTLTLNFTVDDRDNTLALNGRKFYPLEFPAAIDLYAPLVRSANGIESPEFHLGYALEYLPFQDAPEGVVAPIRFTVIDIDGVQVRIPAVEIKVVKLASQELLIGTVDTIPFEETPGSECKTSFCRAKEIVLARFRQMLAAARMRAHKAGKKMGLKGCGGHRKAGHHDGERQGFRNGRLPGHRRPPHGKHHGEHGQHRHHRHHHHGLRRFFHQAMHLFIVPALLGVIGGLTASAIGMFVGQLVVFIWFRFVRGGQRGNASTRSEAALDEEKEALVDDEDEEMPPAYTDAEPVAVIDEKN